MWKTTTRFWPDKPPAGGDQEGHRKLALKYHRPQPENKAAEEKFKQVSEAYAVQRFRKRQQYDQFRSAEQFRQRYSQEDIFRNFDLNDILRGFDSASATRAEEGGFIRAAGRRTFRQADGDPLRPVRPGGRSLRRPCPVAAGSGV